MMCFQKVKQTGFSLIELLIAMVIGLFIMGGVVQVVSDSKRAFVLEQEVSYIQENARFILDELGFELRMAGYFGCGQLSDVTNTVNYDNTNDDHWSFTSNGIKGFESNDPKLPSQFFAVNPGTDVFIVNRGEPDENNTVDNHVAAASTIHLSNSQPYRLGDILVISSLDCKNMSIFQMTGPNSNNPAHINHDKANGNPSPGNCFKALSLTNAGGSYNCHSPDLPRNNIHGRAFPKGSAIMRFKSSGYYIKNSPVTGQPTLYRVALTTDANSASTKEQELLTGVEDMEILYGVDTDEGDRDCIVKRYYSADQIDNDIATEESGWIGWDRVRTVQMNIILRSVSQTLDKNTLVDLGDGDSFNDRYLRQKISNTISIRNRAGGCPDEQKE